MNARLDLAITQAIGAGILPPDTTRPASSERPWPVVLLTALGAWLAALPLLAVVGMLLGGLISRSIGPYLVGVLVLAGAVVVLRAREVPLFVEQLAVPALLVGGGSLGFGLFRDLPDRGAALVLALIAIGLAFVLLRPWLRVLLGAVAAILVMIACSPTRLFHAGIGASEAIWLAVHAALLLWLASLWLQRAIFNDGPRAGQAEAIESLAAGWLLASLAALAALSGTTFLIGASLGGGFIGDIAQRSGERSAAALMPYLMRALSLALALAAVMIAQRAWPTLRQLPYLAVGLVLAALGWFLPALGAVLLVLALTVTTQRFLLAAAAAVAAAWIVGSFYYQLQWELATKSVVLVAAGALLAALAWFAHFRTPSTEPARSARAAMRRSHASGLIALAAVATLAVANFAIWQKETLIAEGQPVFVELAPVDPRSLMQGDFMRLNFRLPFALERDHQSRLTRSRPHVVAALDERGVARILRIHRKGTPLADGEFRIELTPKDGRWVFVTDAWFFREGDGARWEAARYGEFRVDANGKALLVGMADKDLAPIQP